MARAPFLGARGWGLLPIKSEDAEEMGMMWDDGTREMNRLDDDGLVEGVFLRRPWAIFGWILLVDC